MAARLEGQLSAEEARGTVVGKPAITSPARYHRLVKQLLLRVPDDLHRRLAARAAREGRSMNELATEVLRVAASTDPSSRQDRLALKVAALGWSASADAGGPRASGPAQRRAATAAMAGVGPVIDSILEDLRR